MDPNISRIPQHVANPLTRQGGGFLFGLVSAGVAVDTFNNKPAATLVKENWLVVEPTHLKNISQIGSSPQVGVKIKSIWNHHLEKHRFTECIK